MEEVKHRVLADRIVTFGRIGVAEILAQTPVGEGEN